MRTRWILAVLVCLQLFLFGCAANVESSAPIQKDIENAEDVLEIPSATATVSSVTAQLAAHPTPAAKSPVPGAAVISPTPSVDSLPSETPASTPKPTPEPTPEYELENIKDTDGYIKGHDVNLREGPGTEYDKTGEIDYHTLVTITAKTDEWYQIETDDIEGFVLKEFVGVGAISTPTPTPKPKAKSTPKPTPKPEKEEEEPEKTPEPEIESGGAGDYTEDEIYLVAKLIYAEGKSQSEDSFLAMASILYNRCNSKRFGGSVEREVYRSGQFSVVKYSSFDDLKPSSAALSAAESVFNGGNRTIPAGVMYFRAASLGQSWSSSREFYKKIGGNNYYY